MSKILSNRYNVSAITSQFNDYLEGRKLSKVSRKNYVSDLRMFLVWNASQDFNDEFSINSLISYKNYLEFSKLPVSSINRSLSSLRAYGDLLVQNQLLFTNPARMIANVSPALGTNADSLITRFSQDNDLTNQESQILREFLQQ